MLIYCFDLKKAAIGYGQRDPNCALSEDDYHKFDLSKLDSTNFEHLQWAGLLIGGSYIGLRGGSEHHKLERHQFVNGYYSPDHKLWPGYEYYGLSKFLKDKTQQLSMSNNYVRELGEDFARFPVLTNGDKSDPNLRRDVGGFLKRFCEAFDKSLAAEKKKMMAKKGGKETIRKWTNHNRLYKKIKKDGSGFCANSPLGKGKVAKRFEDMFRFFGIPNPELVRPHALRGMFITIVVNDRSVSEAQVLHITRHSSLSSTLPYMKLGATSELNKTLALIGPEVQETTKDEETQGKVLEESSLKKINVVVGGTKEQILLSQSSTGQDVVQNSPTTAPENLDVKPPSTSSAEKPTIRSPPTVELSQKHDFSDSSEEKIILQGNSKRRGTFGDFTQMAFDGLQDDMRRLEEQQHFLQSTVSQRQSSNVARANPTYDDESPFHFEPAPMSHSRRHSYGYPPPPISSYNDRHYHAYTPHHMNYHHNNQPHYQINTSNMPPQRPQQNQHNNILPQYQRNNSMQPHHQYNNRPQQYQINSSPSQHHFNNGPPHHPHNKRMPQYQQNKIALDNKLYHEQPQQAHSTNQHQQSHVHKEEPFIFNNDVNGTMQPGGSRKRQASVRVQSEAEFYLNKKRQKVREMEARNRALATRKRDIEAALVESPYHGSINESEELYCDFLNNELDENYQREMEFLAMKYERKRMLMGVGKDANQYVRKFK